MNTQIRFFTKQCRNCPCTDIRAKYERGTENRLTEFRCCRCDEVWEEYRFPTWVYHDESDSSMQVNNKNELDIALNNGCFEVSEYYAAMVDLGLHDEIDHKYEEQLRKQM